MIRLTQRAAAHGGVDRPADASGASAPEAAPTPAWRRTGLLLLANLGLFVALALALEFGARLFFPRAVGPVFDNPQAFLLGRPFIVPDAERGFALRPDYRSGNISINAAGLRGPELPADLTRRTRVVALGESSTFGWNVGDAETYPASLQRILDRTHPDSFCVLNAGVPSYTSAQALLYLAELLPRYRPQVVVIGVCWNDVLFSTIPNWMPELLVRQQPARWRQFLLRHSGLYRAIVLRRPAPSPTVGYDNPPALAYYETNLERMIDACQRHGARAVLLLPAMDPAHIPDSGMKVWLDAVPKADIMRVLQHWSAAMEEIGRKRGVAALRHPLTYGETVRTSLFIDPLHLTGTGNALLAELVAAHLAAPDSHR